MIVYFYKPNKRNKGSRPVKKEKNNPINARLLSLLYFFGSCLVFLNTAKERMSPYIAKDTASSKKITPKAFANIIIAPIPKDKKELIPTIREVLLAFEMVLSSIFFGVSLISFE